MGIAFGPFELCVTDSNASRKRSVAMSTSTNEQSVSNINSYLSKCAIAQIMVEVATEHSFFNQGDVADSVYFLQKGRAKLTVVSERGKQATIAILSPGDFFGEGSLALG